MMGSGKGTLVDYLTKKLNAPKVYFGGMVYDEVAKRGLDIVGHEKMVREDMRAQEGPAVLAKRAANRADELLAEGATTIIFDGVYSWSEDKYLREHFGNSYVSLAVVVSKNLRYQRVTDRKDPRRHYTHSQVAERDVQEIENLEKGGPIAFADYFLLNDARLNELAQAADSILAKMNLS